MGTLFDQLGVIYEKEKSLVIGSTVWRSASKLEPIDDSYEDITDILKESTKYMKEGELIHNKNFSLLESTSCLEILDARMDNSVDLQKNVIINAQEAMEYNICPKDTSLSYEQLLLFVDEIMKLEVAYYMGSTIIQTIGSIYYIYDYRCIQNPYLATLFRTILMSCHTIRELILSVSVYEDEDFNDYQFGLSLCENLESIDIIKALTLAEEELNQKIRKVQGKKGLEDVSPLQDQPEKELFLCESLLHRIQFRKAFLTTQLNMNKRKGTEMTKKTITNTLQFIPQILKSHHALISNPNHLPPSTLFSPYISKRIYTSPPSGKVFIPSFDESLSYFESYYRDCLSFYQISTSDDLKSLTHYFSEFVIQQKPLLSRSRLHQMFVGKKIFDRVEMADLVLKSMTEYGVMDSIDPSNPKFKEFHARISQFFIIKMSAQCANKARLRRKMTHHFQEIGQLQLLAEDIDAEINETIYYSNFNGVIPEHGAPINQDRFNDVIKSRVQLTLYIGEITVDWMIQFVLLGFELDLYSEHEYRYMFWYLDYLYGHSGQMRMNHIQSLKIISDAKLAASAKAGGKKNKKVKKVAKKGEQSNPPPTPDQYRFEGFHSLYRSLVLFLSGIYERDGEKKPDLDFSTRGLQCFLRFNCFHHFRIPPPLLHSHFLAASKVNDPQQILPTALSFLKYSQTCFDALIKNGKLSEKELAEYKSILRVLIANQINVIRIPPHKGRLNFDFSVNRYCPIISLVAEEPK